MSDIQIFDKNTEDNSFCPPSGPCSYTISSYKTGCIGCNEWEKHYGTDCKELMFCCIPCALITDTLVLPFTLAKWLCCKKK
jgi:hypothetical protein